MKPIKHIPKFKTEAEEAAFWDTHSFEEFADELKEAKNVRFPKPRKRLISLRVDDETILSLRKIAHAKGIGYLTLIRLWVMERLSRERRLKTTH